MNKLLGTAFRDLFGNLMLMFMLFIIMPQLPDESEDKQGEVDRQGQIIVTTIWPNTIDVDIDTWVKHPGVDAVGWSNTGDINCNLLRDDLGSNHSVDLTQMNFEMIQCRRLEPGEWRVNVNYWRGTVPNVPVRVKVEIWRKGKKLEIINERIIAPRECFEDTAGRFRLDEDGQVVGKVDRTYQTITLRAAGKSCITRAG